MAIVRIDKVKAEKVGNIESIKNTVDMVNGTLWVLGGLADTTDPQYRELHNVSACNYTNVADQKSIIVLHADSEVWYDQTKVGLDKYVLPAGQAGRGYILEVGDVITVSSDLIETGVTLAAGNYVGPSLKEAGKYTKLDANDKVTDGTNTVVPKLMFRVEKAEKLGYRKSVDGFMLKVVKA